MKHLLIILAAAAMLAGCESQNKPERFTARAQDQHAGHDHGHDHDHVHGHDHSHDHDHSHGEHLPLGTATAAGVSFEVVQLGMAEGNEQAVEFILAEGSPRPTALRIWIGNEAADGSVKVLAQNPAHVYEAHVELPEPAVADARLWVEVENQEGTLETASFELKR